MKKFISAVSAAALIISSLPAMNTVSKVSAEDDAIKIMCIGDSITDGYTYEYTGSYRKFIYHNLTEMGYNVDMVGSKGGGWTPSYTDEGTGETWEFDNDNTGYSGYAIKEYSGRSGIYETLISTNCLAQTQPDIVTLQIGTNDIIDNHDIDTAGERLEVLVDYILDNIPEDSTLFISPIPPLDPNRGDVYDWFGNYRHSADWSEQYDDAMAEMNVEIALMQYNTQVMALATRKQQEGRNVVFSEAAWEITDVKTQLFDGVHPNNAGYKAMGDKWTAVIDDYLKGDSPVESTTTTTATETTTTATTTVTTETSTTTTETTAEITTVQTTTDDFVLIPKVTTTVPEENDGSLKIADLVKLTRYLIGYTPEMYPYTADDIKRYDLNNDGDVDVFDSIVMRQLLTEDIAKATEKMKENLGEDYSLFPDGDIFIIYPDEYYENAETNKISGSPTASKTLAVKITELETEEQTEEDVIKWANIHGIK
ncbi:MAG: hypothetical protein K2J47_07885 [Ruminococcus sp.]|nr:hypothetical protein [Ruminococcus sp.]